MKRSGTKGYMSLFRFILLSSTLTLLSISSAQEPSQKKPKPILNNGLEIRATNEGDLKVGGTAKITITLKNHTDEALQTLISPSSKENLVWNCTFDPPIHEEMSGPSTFPGVTLKKVATIPPNKTISFSFNVKRIEKGIYIESKFGNFGCLDAPVQLPKGTKELKLFYEHADSDIKLRTKGDGKFVRFDKKRWIGNLKTRPIIIKTS